MKKLILIFLFALPLFPLMAQITITDADMPSVDDTFRVSNGLITPAIDPIPTGTAFTWDFSALEWVTQQVDSFVSVTSTGPIYSVVFINLPFNPYRSNLAAKGPALPTVPQVSVSDVNYFYYKSAAAYELSGYGALINGVGAPIPFNNKDRIYNFPMNYADLDSSDSDFQLSLPGLGFYGHDQHRVNEVDGWGTLITPYGTFDALRVKSVITSNDSLYLDSLGTGFGFSLPQTTEYKWLGLAQGIPLLQINTTLTLGTEIVSSIVYRDSVRILTGLAESLSDNIQDISISPNPVSTNLEIEFSLKSSEQMEIAILNTEGKLIKNIWKGNRNAGSHKIVVDAENLLPSSGVYFVRVESGNQNKVVPFIFSNN